MLTILLILGLILIAFFLCKIHVVHVDQLPISQRHEVQQRERVRSLLMDNHITCPDMQTDHITGPIDIANIYQAVDELKSFIRKNAVFNMNSDPVTTIDITSIDAQRVLTLTTKYLISCINTIPHLSLNTNPLKILSIDKTTKNEYQITSKCICQYENKFLYFVIKFQLVQKHIYMIWCRPITREQYESI